MARRPALTSLTEVGSTGMDAGFYEDVDPLGSGAVLIPAEIAATPVYALMAFSVVLTLMGHVFRDKRIVGIGVALIFVSTALLILGAYQSYGDHGEAIPGY